MIWTRGLKRVFPNKDMAQSNRFLLFGLTISMLLLLGMYLLDLFSVRAFGSESIVMLFATAVVAILVSDGMMKQYKLVNPLYFLVPALFVIGVCYISGLRSIAVAFALMLAMPGVVATARWLIVGKEAIKKELDAI
jgi:hypothetical protein